jgi:hypothetical protein
MIEFLGTRVFLTPLEAKALHKCSQSLFHSTLEDYISYSQHAVYSELQHDNTASIIDFRRIKSIPNILNTTY